MTGLFAARNARALGALALAFFCVVAGIVGCRAKSEARDQEQVEEQQAHYAIAQPVPRFEYSLERDVVGQLYNARNERVATWSVWRSDMGTVEGDCPSIGFPIPYDTSLTNPLQGVWVNGGPVTVEQAEPNGVFASKNSNATWVRCVVSGAEVPIYVESRVTAYPYPVAVDYETNRVRRVDEGDAPSVVIQQKGGGRGDAR